MNKFTLPPCLLVPLHTRTVGGVEYHRSNEIVREVAGAKVEEWETEKVTHDPEEFKRATEARTKVRSLFSGVCVWTRLGLMHEGEDESPLLAAAAQAQSVVDAFNGSAKTCRVEFDWAIARVAASNELAARAIKNDLETLLREMETASEAGNVKELRAAAQRAKQLDRLLGDQQDLKEKTGAAVKAARSIARKITKRVHKEGEDLALVLEKEATAPIRLARFALLGEVEDVAAEGSANFQAMEAADELLGRVDPVDLDVVFEMSAEELAGQRPEGVQPASEHDFGLPDPEDDLEFDDLSDPSPEELEAFHARRAAELGLLPLEGPNEVPDYSSLSEAELFALMNEQHVKLGTALGKDPNLPEIATLRAQQAAARAEFMRRLPADPGGAA